MPPRHPHIPAEQQRLQSIQTVMAAGRDTSRYGAQLVAAAFAAIGEKEGLLTPPSVTEE